jgi:aminopeptidase-like protein
MNLSDLRATIEPEAFGQDMYRLIERLYPICRSITGDGLRQSLRLLQEHIPLTLHEVPSGTPAFDWAVPPEWNIRDAYIKDGSGRRIVDFQRSNLHVVGYSVPIHQRMSLAELRPYLHSLPEKPDWIPYRTAYYSKTWGFCLTHRQLEALGEGTYEVCVDSTLADGHLTYGEYFLGGESDDEVLLSCHICHPSLCNENLSGVALVTVLARALGGLSRRYSYRFLFIPTTIGSLLWLSRNAQQVARIRNGLVVACVGDPGPFTYKRSRRGDAEIDRAAGHVLEQFGKPYRVIDFSPWGFDERQFCSPGFDLPVGGLSRSRHDAYPEYHTSADDLELVRPKHLAESFELYLSVLSVLEENRVFCSTCPYGEPQLGRRGLYRRMGGEADGRGRELPLLWVLNLADGKHSLLDMAERADLPFDAVLEAARVLRRCGLLNELQPSPAAGV